MKKPTPLVREPIYDYEECSKYIGHKLGYDLRDVMGKHNNGKTNREVEYCDYWHLLTAKKEIHNGCEINIGEELFTDRPWENDITQAFIDEFGDDATYYVEW